MRFTIGIYYDNQIYSACVFYAGKEYTQDSFSFSLSMTILLKYHDAKSFSVSLLPASLKLVVSDRMRQSA